MFRPIGIGVVIIDALIDVSELEAALSQLPLLRRDQDRQAMSQAMSVPLGRLVEHLERVKDSPNVAPSVAEEVKGILPVLRYAAHTSTSVPESAVAALCHITGALEVASGEDQSIPTLIGFYAGYAAAIVSLSGLQNAWQDMLAAQDGAL